MKEKYYSNKKKKKEEEKRRCCTYCTAVEMCRRRMPGVGNWRELM